MAPAPDPRGGHPGTGDPHPGHDPHFDEPVLLEEDETVPPRPEEAAADLLRAEPDENPG